MSTERCVCVWERERERGTYIIDGILEVGLHEDISDELPFFFGLLCDFPLLDEVSLYGRGRERWWRRCFGHLSGYHLWWVRMTRQLFIAFIPVVICGLFLVRRLKPVPGHHDRHVAGREYLHPLDVGLPCLSVLGIVALALDFDYVVQVAFVHLNQLPLSLLFFQNDLTLMTFSCRRRTTFYGQRRRRGRRGCHRSGAWLRTSREALSMSSFVDVAKKAYCKQQRRLRCKQK